MTQSYDDFQSSIQIKNYRKEPLSVEREDKLNQSGYANKYINLLDTSNHAVERKLFSDHGENSMKRDQSPLETPCTGEKEKHLIKIELHEETKKKPAPKFINPSRSKKATSKDFSEENFYSNHKGKYWN